MVQPNVRKFTAEVAVQVGSVPFLGGLTGKSVGLVYDHDRVVLKAHIDLEFWSRGGCGLESNDGAHWDGLTCEPRPLTIYVDASSFHKLACTLSAQFCVISDDFVESACFGGGELLSHGLRLARWPANSPGSNGSIMGIPLFDERLPSAVQ